MAEKKDYPTISVPVGSVAEVEDLDPELLRTVATCSEHSDKNAGCGSWEDCDLEHKGVRPHNRPYRFFKRDGSSRECAGHCAHIVRQRLQIEANQGLLEIIGDEGDSYTLTGTERVHPLRDVTCHACMKNECTAHKPLAEVMTVPKLPPAAEHKELKKYAIVRDMRKQRAQNSRERTGRAFFNEKPEKANGKPPAVAEPERGEESRRIDGRTREGKAARAQGA